MGFRARPRGLRFLNGKSWAQVTRDERFFCAHLFHLVREVGEAIFVDHLNRMHDAGLPVDANWELGYEVVFYRDLWHHRDKQGELFSKKRTFDLCLLSDETIVIIEAKAEQDFDADQLETFAKDIEQVTKETGVERVVLAALASSRYRWPPDRRACFDGPVLTWAELAELFSDDAILHRADDVYEPSSRSRGGAHNTGGYMTGAELEAAFEAGKDFWVGRGGGLDGKAIAEDIRSGRWREQRYETNQESASRPNINWFRLGDFMKEIRGNQGSDSS